MSEQVKSKTMPILLGGGLAIAIGVAVFLLMPAPEMAVVDAADVAQTPAVAAETAPEVVVAAPVAPAEPVAPMVPEFDTFRVEVDGAMVIAGRAEPGQVVDVMLAGVAIDRVTA
ncbi:MAG: peptidoglycan-binding protein, partial [Paracoccaceae bacterium]|nr:peptidoglycan-binding protein [Paracoccaceae bacterium]